MRIRGVVIAIALLSTVMAVLIAAPGAYATDWTMSVRSNKVPASYQETVTVTARPMVGSQAVRGVWMTCSVSANGRDFRTVAEGQTDVDGVFSYQFVPTKKVFVRFTIPDRVTATYVQECRAVVAVKTYGAAWTGAYFPYSGEIKPGHAVGTRPVRLFFDKWESGRWVTRITVDPYNSDWEGKTVFNGNIALPSSGSWRVRAVHEDWGHARTETKPQLIVVKDPPVLTKVVMWMSDHYPSPNSTETAYVIGRDQYGNGMYGTATFKWRFETWTRTATRYPWKVEDPVILDRYVLGSPKPGYKVVVEVALKCGDKTMTATNWFVPSKPAPARAPMPLPAPVKTP